MSSQYSQQQQQQQYQQQQYYEQQPPSSSSQTFQTVPAHPGMVYGIEVPDVDVNNNNNNNSSNKPKLHTKRELRGAAAAGGLTGLLLVGPVAGVVAAGGAAALAMKGKGEAGELARASGEAMAKVGDRLKEVNKKHHVMEKTSKSVSKGCKWVTKQVKAL